MGQRKEAAKKISGSYLGKITENGLVPPKRKMVSSEVTTGIVDKQYGACAYLESFGIDIRDRLKKHFPEIWQHIWVLALLRTEDPQPFKRMEQAYEHSWLSEKYPGLNLSKQALSGLLRKPGDMRGQSLEFMREYIQNVEHLIFDGTRITTFSEEM